MISVRKDLLEELEGYLGYQRWISLIFDEYSVPVLFHITGVHGLLSLFICVLICFYIAITLQVDAINNCWRS